MDDKQKNPSSNGNSQVDAKAQQEQRNIDNNAKNISNAADVAIASKNPYAMAAGAAVKAADKITGGKATKFAGKAMNEVNKKAPGGKQIQEASNKLSESGASDAIGTAARMKGGGGGAGAAGAASKAGSASNATTAAGATSKASSTPSTGATTTSPGSSKLAEGSNLKSGNSGGGGGNKPPKDQSGTDSDGEEPNNQNQQVALKEKEKKKESFTVKITKIKIIGALIGAFLGLFVIAYLAALVSYLFTGVPIKEFWDNTTEAVGNLFTGNEEYLDRCYDYWGDGENGKYVCEKTKGFWKKFDKELTKYERKGLDVPEELILYTIFFEYDMSDFEDCVPEEESTGDETPQSAHEEKGCAYNIGDEEIQAKFDAVDEATENGGGVDNLDLSIFEEEKDTIRVLFKNLVLTKSVCNIESTVCTKKEVTSVDPVTKEETTTTEWVDCVESGESFEGQTEASWYEIVVGTLAGIFGKDIENCESRANEYGVTGEFEENGQTKMRTTTHNVTYEERVDIGAYKQYLVEGEYFDDRERFDQYFKEYAVRYNKEVEDLTDEEKIEARTDIWYYIIDLADLDDAYYTKDELASLISISGQCSTISVENKDGSVEQVPLEEYVMGVVWAEFRNAHNYEMYKAQAIASRSYVISKTKSCTTSIKNSSSAQNYSSEVLTSNSQWAKMIREAVMATAGQLVVRNGKVVHAEYDAFCYSTKSSSNYKICQKGDLVPVSWVSSNVSGAENLSANKSHGRGMSQWGALYLITNKGFNANSVLKHYYGEDTTLGSFFNQDDLRPTTDIPPTTGTTLASVLAANGSSVEQLNAQIAQAVSAAGGRTKAGVVAAATNLIKILAGYNFKIPYYWGGKYDAVGVDGKWGGNGPAKLNPNSGITRSNYGLDCSGFTKWAFMQAGVTIASGSQNQRNSGTKRANLESGEPGDLAIKKGHVQLIVARTANGYIMAESSSGVELKEYSYATLRSKSYAIYNTDQNF